MKKNENSRRTIKQDAIGSFKNTCKYYEKMEKRTNDNTLSNLMFIGKKGFLDKDKYAIPYEAEIKGLIFTFHESNSNHVPARDILLKIRDCGISWHGILNRITKELKSCPCKVLLVQRSQIKRIKHYRKIISKTPQERFQIDLANLPKEILTNSQSYLCNIKDHFSKYSWSFLIPDKIAESVGEIIKLLFLDGHVPKIMHSDNGNEFKGCFQKILN